jgi:hypothetical protein
VAEVTADARCRPASGDTRSDSFGYEQSCSQTTFRHFLVPVRVRDAIASAGSILVVTVEVVRCPEPRRINVVLDATVSDAGNGMPLA